VKRRAAPAALQRLEIADRAIDDLRGIADYSRARWDAAKADEYLQLFEDAINRIRSDPSLLRVESDISSTYLLYRVHKYWLICDIVDDTVFVITIRHTSMDVRTRLNELQPVLTSEVRMLRSRIRKRMP
jgi:plasmid stabilization system protein ParE